LCALLSSRCPGRPNRRRSTFNISRGCPACVLRSFRRRSGWRALLESDRLDETGGLAQAQAVAGARATLTAENTEMFPRDAARDDLRTMAQARTAEAGAGGPFRFPDSRQPSIASDISGQEVLTTSTPGLKQPEPLAKPLPPYTPEARAAKIEGLVLLQAVIRKDGSVGEVKTVAQPGLRPG